MAFVALMNDEEVHGELDDLENIILEKEIGRASCRERV